MGLRFRVVIGLQGLSGFRFHMLGVCRLWCLGRV